MQSSYLIISLNNYKDKKFQLKGLSFNSIENIEKNFFSFFFV